MRVTIKQISERISRGGDFYISFRYKGIRYCFAPDIEAATPEELQNWITDWTRYLAKTRAKIRKGTFAKNLQGFMKKMEEENPATIEDCLARNSLEITEWKKVMKCFKKGGKEFIVESDDPEDLYKIPVIYLNHRKLTRKCIEKTIFLYLQKHYIKNPRIELKAHWK